MAVEFTCPACEGTLRAADGPAGRLVRCGGCMAVLRVPAAPPAPPGPAPAPPPVPAYRPDPPDGDDETTAAASRGVRFWLTVTLVAVGVGMLGCCGLATVLVPDPEWRPYDSAKGGGFRVELPAPPRDDMADRAQGAKGQTAEGTYLRTRAESYAVLHWTVKPTRERARTEPDEDWLDHQVKIRTAGKTVVRTEPVEVSGFPGREFEYRNEKGGTFVGRVVVADSRAYVLIAGGRFTRPGNANVRRFLDSFEITDPKLLAEAKERADARKKE